MNAELMEFIGDDFMTVWDQMFCEHDFTAIDENGVAIETDRCVYCGIRNNGTQTNHEYQTEIA